MPFLPWFSDVLRTIHGPDHWPEDGGDVDDGHQGDAPGIPPPDKEPRAPEPGHRPRYCWLIDAGHGPLTPGKRSPWMKTPVRGLPTVGQLIEYERNRDVAERLIELLAAAGVVYRRALPHGQYGNALAKRVRAMNDHATNLPQRGVSLHANAGPAGHSGWQRAGGVETWHHHPSPRGKIMAEVFQRHILAAAGRYALSVDIPPPANRGVRSRPDRQFYVLRRTHFPMVLTEDVFMNHRVEVLLLADPDYRQAIAEAHFDAIMEIETAPRPLTAVPRLQPEGWTALFRLLDFILSRRRRTPYERWRDRRYRYVRRQIRREGRGKIDEETLRRRIALWDAANPEPPK